MRPPRTTPAHPTSEAGAETSARPSARGRRAHAGPPADEGPAEPAGEAPDSPATHAWRGRMQPRTVRARIICLLMVPVVSLLALWAYATVTTAQDISRLRQVQRVDARVRAPSVPPSPPCRPSGSRPYATPPTRRRCRVPTSGN